MACAHELGAGAGGGVRATVVVVGGRGGVKRFGCTPPPFERGVICFACLARSAAPFTGSFSLIPAIPFRSQSNFSKPALLPKADPLAATFVSKPNVTGFVNYVKKEVGEYRGGGGGVNPPLLA